VIAALLLVACGDKYLNLGLGTHYNRSPAERRAAAILVYASAGSELSKALTTLSVEDAMKKVGYQPAIASSSAELDAFLQSRKWDVIVVDGPDTASVAQRVAKTASAPHLVPVLTRPTKEQLKQAEKTYDTVINTPSKNRVFVEVVDDAMDLREMEAQAAAKAAKRPAR
jgi:cellulose biosynthesis protein BcsQ